MRKNSFAVSQLRFWSFRKEETSDPTMSNEQRGRHVSRIRFSDDSISAEQLRKKLLLNPCVLYSPAPSVIARSPREFELTYHAISRQKGQQLEIRLLKEFSGSLVSES